MFWTTTRYHGTCQMHGAYESATPGCPMCHAHPWSWPPAAAQPLTWPAVVPPVCTGTGTQDADFALVASDIKGTGRCGICGQAARLYDGQHLVTHPYRLPLDPEFARAALRNEESER